jgi:hypothetical protein
MVPKNEGPEDRIIRVVTGIVLVAVGLAALGGAGASVLGIVVAAFGGWFVLTGIVGFCPLYVPFGIDTHRKSHVAPAH